MKQDQKNVADDPEGGEQQNCAGFHLTKDKDAGKWFDEPCTSKYRYVCERDF